MTRDAIHLTVVILIGCLGALPAQEREYHVAPRGDDGGEGSMARPLKTISAAARRARPGDTITVHAGVYRERIDPPRGGTSESQRIVYRAAHEERVTIKGSEVITGWKKVRNDTWSVAIPNEFFGSFNPYDDPIRGDWFSPQGRAHHTGAVYRNGHWLIEAAKRDDVLKPVAEVAPVYCASERGYLLNVAWLGAHGEREGAVRVPAAAYSADAGVRKAPCSEGGECIGYIEHGDWVRYDDVDLGGRTESLELRVASATEGGIIEVRLDGPDGRLLGAGEIPHTGGWQSWSSLRVEIEAIDGVRTLCLVFRARPVPVPPDFGLWFAAVDAARTTIWAQFAGGDPNREEVEINVRQAVFYPSRPGIDYLTVRGFTLEQAATPWAPPTAEQIGLIGTHWSRGWIIEQNTVRYATCTGLTLGKYGDAFDNTSQNRAEGYVKTIERALAKGWSKGRIGHHVVRDNQITHCEQAGIVGSMGAAFCTITGNTIRDIHVRRLFGGAEMAGIKFHGAIDTVIAGNHIHSTCRGIWLDWMSQGTRVTRNLLHDNEPRGDLFVEVNHGPFVIDDNFLLSPRSLQVGSHGGAYAHNLIAGRVTVAHHERRRTPFHPEHSTEVAGLAPNPSGDDRFYNNVFLRHGLAEYDAAKLPVFMAGNLFLDGARPSKHEADPVVAGDFDPELDLVVRGAEVLLGIALDPRWLRAQRPLVTSALLGRASIPDLPYVRADGSPYRLDTDYLGGRRRGSYPAPGPWEWRGDGRQRIRVWPSPRRR